MMTKNKRIEETILKLCVKIAKQGKGAIFVLGGNPEFISNVNNIKPFYLEKDLKLVEGLAIIDGAVIIDDNGKVLDYNVMIKVKKMVTGLGARHSAAISASLTGAKTFVVSEEDKLIRVYFNGKQIMEINPSKKDIEKNIHKTMPIFDIIDNVGRFVGVGLFGTIGTTILVPTLGLAFLPGITIFGGLYLVLRELAK